MAVLTLALAAGAQQAAAPPDPKAAAPAPLSTPSITGPLANLPPAVFDAGPFGKISVNGTLSGLGMWTGNYIQGDSARQADLSNGQIFIQKTDGVFQFYVQAGAYNIAALGIPFMSTNATLQNLYGPVPVAFAKLQAGKNTSILVGALPTLIGAEYTFTFENMNIHRGLLWNQENAINRGIQVNQTMGKFTASASWNDGFYSGRYNWLTGLLSYTNGAHSLALVGGGNLGQNKYQTFAAPLALNNSRIFNIIYTYNKDGWIIQPYYQYTSVPTNAAIGIPQGSDTKGYALLLNRTFKSGFSLPVRFEHISNPGNRNSLNLLYGPGSSAQSVTFTPTYQKGGFFVRGDLAYVHANRIAKGSGFDQAGDRKYQSRVMVEFGFIFGNNIVEGPKK